MQGRAEPLYSQVPPGFPGASEAFVERYGSSPDVEAAEALLRAAGFSEDSPLEFDLWYPPEQFGPHTGLIVQVLEEQFEATPMVEVSPQSQEWGAFIGAVVAGEYAISYLAWAFDYPDTSNYLEPFADSNFALVGNYSNPQMDDLLHAAALSTDESEREQLYIEAQELYAEDVVSLPLILAPSYALYRNDVVESLTIGPTLYFDYTLIELK
jgi:peptide/nickel transport system substrate-binding protein